MGDFVNVKLTAAGEQAAPVQVHEGNRSFVFAAGEERRVTRAVEWELILRPARIGGLPAFEIAEERQKASATSAALSAGAKGAKGAKEETKAAE